eukprot:9060403-Ditylum_brightwellii.AAC.1
MENEPKIAEAEVAPTTENDTSTIDMPQEEENNINSVQEELSGETDDKMESTTKDKTIGVRDNEEDETEETMSDTEITGVLENK